MSAFSKCVVCTDPETSENRIFYCAECEINVHVLCYGIDEESTDLWWCSPCVSNEYQPSCELCMKRGGALKKTSCAKWVHVICALFTVGVKFVDKTLMEPVDISNIPTVNRNKKCMLCRRARGVCCQCSQKNCHNWIHITCAQEANCLKEVNEENNKISFLSYCNEHKPVGESSRRLSSISVRESLSDDGEQNQTDQSSFNTSAGDENGSNDTFNNELESIDELSRQLSSTRVQESSSIDGQQNQIDRNTDDVSADDVLEANDSTDDTSGTDERESIGYSSHELLLTSVSKSLSDDNQLNGTGRSTTELGNNTNVMNDSETNGSSNMSVTNKGSSCTYNNVSTPKYWWDNDDLLRGGSSSNELEALLISKDKKIAKVNIINVA